MLKKIIGALLLVVATILTLAILVQIPAIFKIIGGVLAMFRGTLTSDQVGRALGGCFYWIIHFAATFALWRYGFTLLRKSSKDKAFDNSFLDEH